MNILPNFFIVGMAAHMSIYGTDTIDSNKALKIP